MIHPKFCCCHFTPLCVRKESFLQSGKLLLKALYVYFILRRRIGR